MYIPSFVINIFTEILSLLMIPLIVITIAFIIKSIYMIKKSTKSLDIESFEKIYKKRIVISIIALIIYIFILIIFYPF